MELPENHPQLTSLSHEDANTLIELCDRLSQDELTLIVRSFVKAETRGSWLMNSVFRKGDEDLGLLDKSYHGMTPSEWDAFDQPSEDEAHQ